MEFRPEGAVRMLFEHQTASFEHNSSYAQPISFKFSEWIRDISNLPTVEKLFVKFILVALENRNFNERKPRKKDPH